MTTPRPFEPPHHARRRLSRWVAVNAWKLAGLTAIVTFVGVFIAVSLSLLLRPTRSYFFPLLSDVDKHQPEGAILRISFIAATALLIATTSASLLHCHALKLFTRDPVHEDLDLTAPTLVEGGDDAYRIEAGAAQADNCEPSLHAVKRRRVRISSVQMLILIPMSMTVIATFLQYTGLAAIFSSAVNRRYLLKLGFYTLSATWTVAMCFLVWYFLKLQSMPDRHERPLAPPIAEAHVEDSMAEASLAPSRMRIYDRFRAWAGWMVVVLRPVCLTGQVVCIIKIVGLWLALDTFSISNIRLVKIALLAALAFAEYTAAFFFAFFMTILAVDMRAKSLASDHMMQA